jgi:pimeloyl-ACP methyl ester carboxylesterase
MSEFEQWRRDARHFTFRDKHEIAYWTAGDGPTLLLIHGFPSASWDWWPMWPALTARFRVIAADMLGFGWSAKPGGIYSIIKQAELQNELMRLLDVSDYHVLAHDYGDTVAQELLAQHESNAGRGRRQLRSVCFLNGGLFPETHRARRIQKLLATWPLGAILGRLGTRRAFGAGLRAVFGPNTPPSEQFVDELWTMLRHDDGQRVLHRLIGYMAERRGRRERWVRPLISTKVPLRVIDGMLDPVSGAHMVARYRELVPDADVVELPHIGHYPQIEDPPAVLAAFLAFHDRLAGA